MKKVCRRCGDRGYTEDNPNSCPVCGKRRINIFSDRIQDDITVKEEIDFIPISYKYIEFDVMIIKQDHANLSEDICFGRYIRSMAKIYDAVKIGKVPKTSCYFSAPQNYGKQTFVYCVLNTCKNIGMKVAPYLDINEIHCIMRAEMQGDKDKIEAYKEQYKCTDFDIMTSEILFVKIPTLEFSEIYKKMVYLLERRGRNGLPTIFISRLPLGLLCENDTYNTLMSCINTSNNKAKNFINIPYREREEQ